MPKMNRKENHIYTRGRGIMTDCPYGGVCTVTCEYYSVYGCTQNDDNGDWQDINWLDSDDDEG